MPRKPRRPYDPRAKALRAQRPPADAVSYMPPPGRLSLIIKLVGTDQDRLTRPGERGLYCYTDRLSYRPGDTVRFPHLDLGAAVLDRDRAGRRAARGALDAKRPAG